jgi:hypothetical protein
LQLRCHAHGVGRAQCMCMQWHPWFTTPRAPNSTPTHTHRATACFVRWEARVPACVFSPQQPAHAISVPTVDTCRYGSIVQACLGAGRPLLLLGGTGTGKSLILKVRLRACHVFVGLNCSNTPAPGVLLPLLARVSHDSRARTPRPTTCAGARGAAAGSVGRQAGVSCAAVQRPHQQQHSAAAAGGQPRQARRQVRRAPRLTGFCRHAVCAMLQHQLSAMH